MFLTMPNGKGRIGGAHSCCDGGRLLRWDEYAMRGRLGGQDSRIYGARVGTSRYVQLLAGSFQYPEFAKRPGGLGGAREKHQRSSTGQTECM